jgi:hypothetical protein
MQGNPPSATEGGVETLKGQAQELASTVARKAEEAWDSTKHGAQQLASNVATTAEEAWENVNSFFSRYSIPLFFAGIGLGFMIARALDNMTSDIPERMSRASDRG